MPLNPRATNLFSPAYDLRDPTWRQEPSIAISLRFPFGFPSVSLRFPFGFPSAVSGEGHFWGSTTNAHTRGPVLSLVTNWGEVLHQSVKLKLQHGLIKQLINFLRPMKPVYSSSFSLRQTAKSVAILHMASFAPVRSQQILHPSHQLNQLCQRATRTGRFFFQEPIRPIPFPISSNRFPCLFPFPLESLESNVAIGFSKKHPASFFVQ